MNTHLDASDQVSAIVRSCNHHLRRIAQVRQYISEGACKLAVLALVISRLDYCNGLFAGATEPMYDKLQRIQNRAARLVVRQRVAHGQTLHLMPVLQRLHWLPVRQRVIYKLCLQVFKCLHGIAPSYLMELLHLHTRDRRLRPASLLQYHCVRRNVGLASLVFVLLVLLLGTLCPPSLRAADSLLGFKKQLKTYLWQSTYSLQ